MTTPSMLPTEIPIDLIPRGFHCPTDSYPTYIVWTDGSDYEIEFICWCKKSVMITPDIEGRVPEFEHELCGSQGNLVLHEFKRIRESKAEEQRIRDGMPAPRSPERVLHLRTGEPADDTRAATTETGGTQGEHRKKLFD